MTLDEFVKKYKNGVDYDGAYGKQCVDYVNEYAKDVLGVKNAFVGPRFAYQCYTEYADYPNIRNNFNRVPNAKTNYPTKGDVIIWSKERNGYAGHIAVVLDATEHTIKVAEQNYDGKGSVREYTYPNYNNVLGWLVPKNKKVHQPSIKTGQTVTLKTKAKVYKCDRNDSPVKRINELTQYATSAQCVLKKGAKVKVDKVIAKKNGNIWIYSEHYKGYIGIYSYRTDTSKV